MRKLTEREKILFLVLGIAIATSGLIHMYAYHLEAKVERLWDLYLSEIAVTRRLVIDEHPSNGVTYSLHDKYENSRIVGIDKEKQEVEVWLVESKLYLLFKPDGADHFKKFRKGFIAPVTVLGFDHSSGGGLKCSVVNQSQGLFISNSLVKLINCDDSKIMS